MQSIQIIDPSSHLFNTFRSLLLHGKDNEVTKKYLENYSGKLNTNEQAIMYILNNLNNVANKSFNYIYEVTRIVLTATNALYEQRNHIDWDSFSYIFRNEITEAVIIAIVNELEHYPRLPQNREKSIRELHRLYIKLERDCDMMGTRIPIYDAIVDRLIEIRDTGMISTRVLFSDAFLELRTGKPIISKKKPVDVKIINKITKNLELLHILKYSPQFDNSDRANANNIIDLINMDPSIISKETLNYLSRELDAYGNDILRCISLMNRIRRGRGFIKDSPTTLAVQKFMNQAFAITIYISSLDLEIYRKDRIELYVNKFYTVWGVFPPLYDLFEQAKEFSHKLEVKKVIGKLLLNEIQAKRENYSFAQDDYNKFYTGHEFGFAADNFHENYEGNFRELREVKLNKPLTKYKQYKHKCETRRFSPQKYVERVDILQEQNQIVAQFGLFIGEIIQLYSDTKA
jgi:hypothetical protein